MSKITTALLVVDVQNDFCHPDGVCGEAGYPVTLTWPAAENVATLLHAAREGGVPVVHLRLEVDWATEDRLWLDQLLRLHQPELCSPGRFGAGAYTGAEEHPGEPVVVKRRYSGFWQTGLSARLRELSVDTVVVCGVATNICVQATACDAFMDGFAVEIVADASAAYDTGAHDAALALIELAYGRVVTTPQLVARWSATLASAPQK